ncbi:uncharacterized protein N7518_005567 [Penicillium psychrosexuale]|uniref:uncharacterized protein n=1 Tax=Penicillium psychrosexuale TaxID=1002107 RepID=UPI00254560D9|nr:uncharacterized protein N7518_005567 [Penicillium psychrosexuale]KAJ5797027.1 hypothetical protein N7518_005567 [Penicillium psychrosexuale]
MHIPSLTSGTHTPETRHKHQEHSKIKPKPNPHNNNFTQSEYAKTPKQNENENAKKLGATGTGAWSTRPNQGSAPTPGSRRPDQFQSQERKDMTALAERMAQLCTKDMLE